MDTLPVTPAPAASPLSSVIEALDRAGSALSTAQLRALLSVPLGLADVAAWSRFDPAARCRTVVRRTRDYEVVVVGWMPGQRSPVHDHGSSACAFRVLRGQAQERLFHTASPPQVRWHAVGDVAALASGEVHEVGNPADSAEPLVTLHVYAPPLAAVATVSASGARGRAHLAVIGGGFCAADLAVLLARRGALAALDLTVIDPGRAVGRGVAYEAHADALLNVPAARMSMIPEEPGHFLAWARRRDPAVAAEDFLPRALYGAYIEETLAREAGGAVGVVKRRAMDVAQTESGWEVALEGGGRVAADAVVLATGNPPPAYPAGLPPELRADPRYIADPWRRDALAGVRAADTVLVLGTGLTALDALLVLREQGHRGRIKLLSRRGVLPAPHADRRCEPARLPAVPRDADLGTWVRAVRAAADAAIAAGQPWQAVVDALRPISAELWAGFDAADRRRFLEHLRPWWDRHRHRAPVEVLRYVYHLRVVGALQVDAGTLVDASADPRGFTVGVRLRGQPEAETWRADHLINATGPDMDLARSGGALYRNLIARGHISQDPLRLGLRIDATGEAIGAAGQVSPGLYVLGGACRAQRWESTAVPELRAQAEALAARLVAELVVPLGATA